MQNRISGNPVLLAINRILQLISYHRKVTATITLLIASGLSLGIITANIESNILNSFLPYNSPTIAHQSFVNDNFILYPARSQYINGYPPRDDQVLTIKAFKQWNSFQQGIETVSFNYNNINYRLQDLCDRPPAPPAALAFFDAIRLTTTSTPEEFIGLPCNRQSPLDAFNEGSYDYYNGLITSNSALIYFPYLDATNTSRSAILPFSTIGLPNAFLNISGLPNKPSLGRLTQDSQVISAINNDITMWANIPLAKDLVLGGNSYNNGQLVASKRLILTIFIMNTTRLAHQLYFNQCSAQCRADIRQNTGLCLGNALQAPASSQATSIGSCIIISSVAWQRCKSLCPSNGYNAAYWSTIAETIINGWENQLKEYITSSDVDSDLAYNYLLGNSLDNSLGTNIFTALLITLCGYTLVLMIVTIVIAITYDKLWLLFVTTSGLAITATFGLGSLAGIPLTIQSIQLIPLVIVLSFTIHSLSLISAANNIKWVMSHLLINILSLVAFIVATFINRPVVRELSQYGCIAICLSYLLFMLALYPSLKLSAPPAIIINGRYRKSAITSSILLVVLLIISIVNITVISKPSVTFAFDKLLARTSYIGEFYRDTLHYYNSYPHSLVTSNIDYANNMYQLMRLQQSISQIANVDRDYNFTSSWIDTYWRWANINNNATTGDCNILLGVDCSNLIDTNHCWDDLVITNNSYVTSCQPNANNFYRGLNIFLNGGNAAVITQLNISDSGVIIASKTDFIVKALTTPDSFAAFIDDVTALLPDDTSFVVGQAFTFYQMNIGIINNIANLLVYVPVATSLTTFIIAITAIKYIANYYHNNIPIILIVTPIITGGILIESYSLLLIGDINVITICNLVIAVPIILPFIIYILTANNSRQIKSLVISYLSLVSMIIPSVGAKVDYFYSYYFIPMILITSVIGVNSILLLPIAISISNASSNDMV